ncbi:hypothetical protein RI129_010638 [Pyrocoelia pectoralis]|uniref:glutathione transferase n=1 Tax=Pyrocoelia pectoralis TaxID=417401 RepID=A0AAN7ZDT4_9COLE
MAPIYKLTYFNAMARVEPIRFLLSYGNIEFEDIRISQDDWSKIKPNMPFGQLPLFEFDDFKANQSIAICRYVAKQVKLVGSNDIENLEIDAVVDTVSDMRAKTVVFKHESDSAKKENLKKTLVEETLPYYLERFEAFAKSKGGYLAVGKLTWADIYFVAYLESMCTLMGKNLIENCPTLQNLEKRILNLPGIKAWIAKRPVTAV